MSADRPSPFLLKAFLSLYCLNHQKVEYLGFPRDSMKATTEVVSTILTYRSILFQFR